MQCTCNLKDILERYLLAIILLVTVVSSYPCGYFIVSTIISKFIVCPVTGA